MEKTINLRDFDGQKVQINIPDFEQIAALDVEIISGDEVLTVTYQDKTKKVFDSSENRCMNFYDDEYELPLSLIDDFSNFDGSAYKCADMISEKTKEIAELEENVLEL